MLFRALERMLPRGVRPPGPSIQDDIDGYGNWWGPTYNALPYDTSGQTQPTIVNAWGDLEAAAMSIPAAWRAMNLIAGTIAQMPLAQSADGPAQEFGAQARGGGAAGQYDDLQMLKDPWPFITYYDWMFACVCSVVMRGNFYAVKVDFDEATGWPRQLLPVHVDDVQIKMDNGYPEYHIDPLDRTFGWQDVFHVRGFMFPGMIRGIGVIEAHRSGLTATRTLMDYGQSAYAGGAIPPFILKVNKPEVSEDEAEYLQSRWITRHGNVADRRPAVLPGIIDVEKMGLSMEDAEYLESRQFSVAEIAYMFNLDPEDLSAGYGDRAGNLTYSNQETRTRDRLIFSLQPWVSRIEQTFSKNVPMGRVVKMNTDELLRSDSAQRFNTYKAASDARIWTINEMRAMEGYPPIPGGDVLLASVATVHVNADADEAASATSNAGDEASDGVE